MSERFIELIKDDSNTFGFNIKGGIDLGQYSTFPFAILKKLYFIQFLL